MSRETILIEDEEFNKKLLQTTTTDEYMNCHVEYLGEPIGNREVGFASDEVAEHFINMLMKEAREKGLTEPAAVMPDGTKVYISPGIGSVSPELSKLR